MWLPNREMHRSLGAIALIVVSLSASLAITCYQCTGSDPDDPCVNPPAQPNFTNVTCGGLCYNTLIYNVTTVGVTTTVVMEQVSRGCINQNPMQPEICALRRQDSDVDDSTRVTRICLCITDGCNRSGKVAAGSRALVACSSLLTVAVALRATRSMAFWFT